MKKLISKTKGFKTYTAAMAMVAYVLYGYYLGEPLNTELLLEAMAIMGLRHSIK